MTAKDIKSAGGRPTPKPMGPVARFFRGLRNLVFLIVAGFFAAAFVAGVINASKANSAATGANVVSANTEVASTGDNGKLELDCRTSDGTITHIEIDIANAAVIVRAPAGTESYHNGRPEQSYGIPVGTEFVWASDKTIAWGLKDNGNETISFRLDRYTGNLVAGGMLNSSADCQKGSDKRQF